MNAMVKIPENKRESASLGPSVISKVMYEIKNTRPPAMQSSIKYAAETMVPITKKMTKRKKTRRAIPMTCSQMANVGIQGDRRQAKPDGGSALE
ncbi:hypothetical protein KAM429_43390 [Aquipseudomonas alcaligenes]|uniref:Uncharacterized protein n=1 Tax=Aquipseudomonas alcaligenes TaxID=43263 RepID=A0AA37FMW2_AQUAC|nr:hypothetical protein KAM428_43130 [Pseudomonas alcaligenes]GIZ73578.1 hypothetical protein KAM429_43390 [Pseudomonas alcaligenes]GIZ77942.1 hypothetical protein KAM430_43510 [Pseudomonas alcaligenes]GIZ86663.1 hypothetical protein KAM434_43580 [Pseudomonas alcaligenes]GIZ91022.1 hypothetical protein KAM435_43490 [Pseudomonas alcaligenes]